SRRRHTRCLSDWSSDVCSSDLMLGATALLGVDGMLDGQRRRARFFHRNLEVPVMVLALGSRAAAQAATLALDQLPERPPVTLERSEERRGGRQCEYLWVGIVGV